MDQVHWTATGFLVISLIFGAMSVYNCFTVQQELNSLPESVALLNWLSRTQGPPQAQSTLHDATSSQEPIQTESFGMELRMQATPQVEGSMTGRLAEREASALAAVMLATPSGLLGLSVLAFIYGLGIYLGCVYTDNLAPGLGQGGSLGVLIFYILAALISRFLGILPRNTRASIFWQMLGA
ncbi:hypothetical protein F5Y04DRAFT_241486 [Hypomontagnella monticulosa]|nr:hypothetical protein F5Y04DRAFT_241486 [Hypomontagnella monticulosa]